MKINKLTIIALCLSVFSCVDNRYNLSDINTDISWGGDALTIPLISTKKIELKEIIDEDASDFLSEMNGKYGLYYESPIPVSDISIPEINFDVENQNFHTSITFTDFSFSSYAFDIEPMVSYLEFDLIESSKLPQALKKHIPQKDKLQKIRRLTKSDPVSSTMDISFELSPEITAVKRIDYKGDPKINFAMVVEDKNGTPLPSRLVERIGVKNLSIKLPSTFKCHSSDPFFNSTTNEYQFADGQLGNGFSVILDALDFGIYKEVVDGELNFSVSFITTGEAYITSLDGLSFEDITLLNSATVKQTISFSTLRVENADIRISEIMFQSEGVMEWGDEPISGVSDYFKSITTLQLDGDPYTFELIMTGDLLRLGNIKIPTLKIVLPEFAYSKGKNVVTYKNLLIDDTGKVTTPIKIDIDSLYFPEGKEVVDGMFDMRDNISYFIEVVKPEGVADVQGFNNEIDVELNMAGGSQSITHLRGKINKEVNYSSKVDLSDLPDFLKNENNNLLFSKMHLEFELEHNIGFNMLMGLAVKPIDKNGEFITENIVMTDGNPILITPSIGSQQKKQKLWLAATDEGMPADYQFIEIPNIANLIRRTPESMNFDIDLKPNSDKLDFIEADKTYSVSGNTVISVPFVFKTGFKLFYDDVIELDDLLSDDVLDMLFSNSNNELQFLVNFYNTIPLHLNGSFEALDVNSQPINNVTITPNASKPMIIQPGTEQNEKMTPIIISIKGNKSELKKLKKLKYNILLEVKEGESTAGGASLSPTNSIRMEIKGRILGNTTFK